MNFALAQYIQDKNANKNHCSEPGRGQCREDRLNMKRSRCFFPHSNDRKNVSLSNIDIAETAGGLALDKEANQG